MVRTFRLAERASQSGEPVLDVPTLALLQHFTPGQLVADFKRQWGALPVLVALPVVEPDGLLFDVSGLADTKRSAFTSPSPDLPGLADVIAAFADLNLSVVLTATYSMSFFNSQELLIENILGSSAAQVCLGNPISRETVAAVIGTGIDIALEALRGTRQTVYGVALDVSNVWPMTGTAERIVPTCFCRHCKAYFEDVAPDLVNTFRTFPNALSLALKAGHSGISFDQSFGPRSSPGDIVGLARLRGFDAAFEGQGESDLLSHATNLLRYVRARHDQTVACVADVFAQAVDGLEATPKRILITEGAPYAWPTGLWLADLDSPRDSTTLVPCDELWLDTAIVGDTLKQIAHRSYMWKRGRYFISTFLDECANACDPVSRASTGLSRYTAAEMRQKLSRSYRQVVGTGLRGQSSLIGLSELKSADTKSERVGFVGVALPDGFGDRFIGSLNIAPGLADTQGASAMSAQMAELLEALGYGPQEANDE